MILKNQNSREQLWTTVALSHLCLVAVLGVLLRSKILFPLPFVNFTNLLHAHSHFAFAGWVTLALFTLMICELLPLEARNKPRYRGILLATALCSVAMLVSFTWQGYALFSIIFSTLFIFVTYIAAYFFTRDIARSDADRAVKTLAISAMISLVLSSSGPFALTYMLVGHAGDNLLYRDSLYTYLHFQYNGFFTLSVFALLFKALYPNFTGPQLKNVRIFAYLISFSVIPTLFISYLWHYDHPLIFVFSVIGLGFIIAAFTYFLVALRSIREHRHEIQPFIRSIGLLSVIAFLLKSLLQTGTIVPELGRIVYSNRAIIIGYLHLVFLGFVSLYLLSHFMYKGLLNGQSRFTRYAVRVFAGGVIANEAILMVQGFGYMLMISYDLYTWLLWGASIWLLAGALMLLAARLGVVVESRHPGTEE